MSYISSWWAWTMEAIHSQERLQWQWKRWDQPKTQPSPSPKGPTELFKKVMIQPSLQCKGNGLKKLTIDIWVLGYLGFFNGKSNAKKYIDYPWLMKQSSTFNLSFYQASTMDISNLQDLSLDVRLDSCFLGDIQIDLYNWNRVPKIMIFGYIYLNINLNIRHPNN